MSSKDLDLIVVPGVGEVEITRHARERMRERNVSTDEIRVRMLSDRRKLLAIQHLVTGTGIQITLGRLTFALATVSGRVRVLSVWWRGTPGGVNPVL